MFYRLFIMLYLTFNLDNNFVVYHSIYTIQIYYKYIKNIKFDNSNETIFNNTSRLNISF